MIIHTRIPRRLLLASLGVSCLGLLSFGPGRPGTEEKTPETVVAMETSAELPLRPAESAGRPVNDVTDEVFAPEGLLDLYRVEDLLAESIRVSPMWEADVTAILDYRVRATAPGTFDVDIVFEASDHAMPVRMATRVTRSASGDADISWQGAFNAGEALVQASPEDLDAATAGYEVLGYLEEIELARIALPSIAIDETDGMVAGFSVAAGVREARMHDLVFPAGHPNDPNYPGQSHLQKVDPEFAWSLMPEGALTPSGRRIVLAVVDNGQDIDNPDLNVWTNPGEVLDGTDTDGNGRVDDLWGWNWASHSNFVNGKSSHGTQVARIAGAITDNGIGGASPAGNAAVMAVVYANDGAGDIFAALNSVAYAFRNGAQVINCSFVGGGGGFWDDVARVAAQNNALIVAAAGNSNRDIAVHGGFFPAQSSEPNIVSVGASTLSDGKTNSSNFSKTHVDLFAPGSATSWSTPLVSSAAALLFALRDDMTWQEVKDLLLAGVDKSPALADRCVTGGRLNVSNSVALGLGVDRDGFVPEPEPEPEPEPAPNPEEDDGLLPHVAMVRWVQTDDLLIGVNGENAPNEGLAQLVDDKATTKWLSFSNKAVFELEFADGLEVAGVVLVSGNDHPQRDPSLLEFISHETGEKITVPVPAFGSRRQAIEISIDPPLQGSKWRLVMHNTSGSVIQLSEMTFLYAEAPEPAPEAQIASLVANGTTEASLSVGLSGTADRIAVEFRAGDEAFAPLTDFATDGAGEETVVVEGLLAGTEYTFRVRAGLGETWGEWSANASLVMPEPAPVPDPEPEAGEDDGLEPVPMVRWIETPDFVIGVDGENASKGEGLAQLVDESVTSKWLSFSSEAVFEFEFNEGRVPVAVVLTSGNDRPERDPARLEFISHETLESVVVEVPAFTARRQTVEVDIRTALEGPHWRMIAHNHSGDIIQLSELSFVYRATGDSGLQAWLASEGYPADVDPRTPCPRWNGIPLGLVYAFGLYAGDDTQTEGTLSTLSSGGSGKARLPGIEATASGAENEYVFWRNRMAPGVILRLEGSTNLSDWTTLAEIGGGLPTPDHESLRIEDRGNGLERISWTFSAHDGNVRFFRVNAVLVE
ncbi:MAG: S8 family serine peptidase [Opitutales bacterium]|nr:S8 family serine peptidase [Opitutales bacterium]